MSLVIRADASLAAGTGHVMRCLALAQAWRDAVGPVCFVGSLASPALERRLDREGVVLRPPGRPAGSAADAERTAAVARERHARWVVVDGYHLPPDYRAAVRRAGHLLLVIDDNGDRGPYDCDVLLNQNAHAHPDLYAGCPPSVRLLLGTDYVLLRQEFLRAAPRRAHLAPHARRLLITMGGADAGNATLRVMAALGRLSHDGLECEAVLGAANPHRHQLEAESAAQESRVRLIQDPPDLAARMARADAAVSAAGATLWELCFFGIPTLAVGLADNQRPALAHLGRRGAVLDGSDAWATSPRELGSSLDRLIGDRALRTALSRTSRELVDGRGAARVVTALRELEERANDRPA